MIRAGALRRLASALLLAATVGLGTSACLLVPVPEPAVVAPGPVLIVPRPHYHYYRGGYHQGGHRRGWGHRGP